MTIPSGHLRSIAESWLAEFDAPEFGFHRLEVGSGVKADTWRKRLSDAWTVSRRTDIEYPLGWWAHETLSEDQVDEFLAAADLVHLWYEEPLAAYSKSDPDADTFDETCAACSSWIDWRESLAGVRIELHRPNRWRQWWSLCSTCAADGLPLPKLVGVSGNQRRIPDAEVRRLYKLYVSARVGLEGGIVTKLPWREWGFASERSCATSLSAAWKSMGLPLRSRHESKRLNKKLRPPSTGRLTEKQTRQAHALHLHRDLSLNELGRQLHGEFGYKTAHSCAIAIATAFRALGLSPRGRIEMVVAVSTKNGLSPRDSKERRRRRLEAGLTQKGKERNVPCGTYGHVTSKGPCMRPVMYGATCCQSHSPERQEAIGANLARMRATNAAKWEPAAELVESIHAWKSISGGTWRELAALAGLPEHYVSHLAGGKIENVGKDRAAKLRAALEELTRHAA